MFELNFICEKDLELVFKWRNLENIRYNMINNQIISWQEHCNWFENLQNRNDREFFLFSIDKKKVGIVSFTEIDLKNHKCKWGFYIGEPTAPRGSGTLMAYYTLEYMFSEYNLHKVNSEVFDFNTKSLEFHKKLRFMETGVLKEEIYRSGTYYDLILFSLFKTEWDKAKKYIEIANDER